MRSLKEVEDIGERIVSLRPQPVPRFRILRDVLQLAPDDPNYAQAKADAMKSKWVLELQDTQHTDGTWGRFHTQDTSIRQKFPTTETAISRALALGLDKDSEVLQNALGFMLRHLAGQTTWSDPPEKHEGWPVNIRFVTGGTLAKIDPQHPALQSMCRLWAEIVERIFHSGDYDGEAERLAHLELNGIKTKNKYVKLAALYPLLLLSAAGGLLSEPLEKTILDWLWNKEGGIYYVYEGYLNRIPEIESRKFISWLGALELLSRFNTSRLFLQDAVEWVWEQRNPEGFWDFGPRARASIYFPLSDSWRNPMDRKIDCSVRILAFLREFSGGQGRHG